MRASPLKQKGRKMKKFFAIVFAIVLVLALMITERGIVTYDNYDASNQEWYDSLTEVKGTIDYQEELRLHDDIQEFKCIYSSKDQWEVYAFINKSEYGLLIGRAQLFMRFDKTTLKSCTKNSVTMMRGGEEFTITYNDTIWEF